VVFLGGALLGSIIFNELFPWLQPLYTWGEQGEVFLYQTLNLSLGGLVLVLTLIAVASFWGAEFLEQPGGEGHRPFLTRFSLALVGLAGGLLLFSGWQGPALTLSEKEKVLLAQVEAAEDHIEPEELAEHLRRSNPKVLVVDIRPTEEYQAFHLRGALNLQLNKLAEALEPHRDKELIVLYSNGMTHPAQARDSLYRQGYRNMYILTDGLKGFLERCLKPVSLREEPLPPAAAAQVKAWREYFGSP
jgi:thiosulfate/3-mercaptopyruvate sulfurtransferase